MLGRKNGGKKIFGHVRLGMGEIHDRLRNAVVYSREKCLALSLRGWINRDGEMLETSIETATTGRIEE